MVRDVVTQGVITKDVADNAMIGVIGASSFVGNCLLKLLGDREIKTVAFSREINNKPLQLKNVEWRLLNNDESVGRQNTIKDWIYIAPIWSLADYFIMLKSYGIRRIVVLSSTSRFTKISSSDQTEKDIANRLIESEQNLIKWAEQNKIEWVILRPTLIYGLGKDHNISSIARFIKNFRFYPVFGAALGKRQPVYAGDVANACYSVLKSANAKNKAYNISGAETVGYQEMVSRVFYVLGRKPRIVRFPLRLFKMVVLMMSIIPRFRKLSAGMAERMNQDLVFDYSEAAQDFGYSPRSFDLDKEDIPN